jgi:hypothetical protein
MDREQVHQNTCQRLVRFVASFFSVSYMDVLLVTVLNTVERLAETDGPMAWQNSKTFGEAEVGQSN